MLRYFQTRNVAPPPAAINKTMTGPSRIHNLILYSVGFFIRLSILKSHSIANILGNRVEISTPVNSWKKAVEGVSLWKQGTNPYDSDIFHESPLGLVAYDYLLTVASEWLPLIFSVCDVLTAVFLYWSSKEYLLTSMEKEKSSKCPDSALPLLIKESDVAWIPFQVAAVYLLCPFSIASCGGKSTVTFLNLLLAIFLFFTVCGEWFFSSIMLAVISCHTFYHITLFIPMAMYTYQMYGKQRKINKALKIMCAFAAFFLSVAALLFWCFKITKSWTFLHTTYGCILSVPDLTPNIGLFWYFFTEMFEHFRVFFLYTFQINVFVYTAPLAIRLNKEPIFFLFIHLIIITIFKSYPCIGDVAFYFALIPIWSHLFNFMKQGFIVSCILASCTLLAPTLWHLWIYSQSANANFFFAITLAFNTGQVFLLTDVLSAYIKREYYLEKGVKYNGDGTLVLMRLQ